MTIPKLPNLQEGDYSTLEKKLFGQIDELVAIIMNQREEIQLLKDEIARLKGQKTRPKIPPSILEGPKSKDSHKNRIPRGSHPRCKKTDTLQIHQRQRIKPISLPEGSIYKGINKFTVQDIVIESSNTVYELERWKSPDGTYITGELPKGINGHYGPKLIAYILHQYHGCRVTEPLLLVQLLDIGVKISSGQLSNILIQNKDYFHKEKDELLEAGIVATKQIQVDDTGARHLGKNGYATVIGNQFFTSIVTTLSKSRINFLSVLHGKDLQYLINQDSIAYIETIKPSHWLKGYLKTRFFDDAMNLDKWGEFLHEANITVKDDIKLATEAALFANLIKKGVPRDLGVHGDDAGQFNIFIRSLCWIHEERHYRKIIPINETMRQEVDKIRDGIWEIYKRLQEYRIDPFEDLKSELSEEFENLFKQKTSSPTLNDRLAKTYAKKDELLRVLEIPSTPLHNNGTETDAREFVVKRKVSGGTRSEEGKKARDSFISLKKTCVKLEINFFSYLHDRVLGIFNIPRLADIIKMRAAELSLES